MKKLLFILIILVVLVPVNAQTDTKRADTYFERAYYRDAIPLYEALLPKNKSAQLVKNLADCYYHTFDMRAAAKWYEYLASHYAESMDENHYFKLNQSLKAIGQYEKADRVLIDHYQGQNLEEKVRQTKRNGTYLKNVRAIGERFAIKNLSINTASSEFGAAIVDSVVVYSATRKKPGVLPKLYRWNNQNYLDLYSHPKDRLQSGDTLSTPFSQKINSRLHEGTFAITKDRKTLYFTRNSKKRTEDEKISHLKIYRADQIDGTWTNITELPFNGDGFSTEHPALNPDETRLYFSSDRDGGHGGFDIYYVAVQKDGTYGSPVNLGGTINTAQKEQFPFVDQKGNLYFSSNGHPGFGLLDIFLSKNDEGSFSKPDNLGLPLNSGYDDFAFWLSDDEVHGFFASNRPEGKGSDDIYSFRETRPLIIEDCWQLISGVITDRTTKEPLARANIEIVKSGGTVRESLLSAPDGSFTFVVDCNASYRITAQKQGYESNSKMVPTDDVRKDSKDGSLSLESLQVIGERKALALQKEREAAEKKALAAAKLRKEQEELALRERLLREEENRKKQAETRQKEKSKRAKEIEKAIATEEAIVKKDDRTLLEIGEIHFDYSLWYLRREARMRLNKVVEIMKKYPNMVLEIGTHTDIRGNSAYNRELSQKRADAAKDYLVKNGIAKNRVIAKGYGESRPIVKCETEESCTEEDHEWNRRCELVVVKWE
ncbi:OmpA family protein [Pseudozobellia thermophila]|uniref:Outer membrane protein OmpA n=1 Tax=Pseudozobellia thermophila TaxID=192903 RepID=A0A1M6LU05_9FLAO|nr:OmpA family protein [Pseudozobellia thermophila]SHJ74727.1 Outer membrane protein OmpA [Pseudozobellia thermophila]